MAEIEIAKINKDIASLKNYWRNRNVKFKEWFDILVLTNTLATRGMETYVSNEPMSFYNMAHYLLTKGELTHTTPIANESALELDRRAKVSRGCEYMWEMIDRDRQLAGGQPYVDELAFYLLVLGWYSKVDFFDQKVGLLRSQIWNPYDVYPRYANNRMSACVHSYEIDEEEAKLKAEENGWDYKSVGTYTGRVTLDDYFTQDSNGLHNVILIDGKPVTGWVDRPEMQILVAPVAGFPDKGSLATKKSGWVKLAGRGIFEVNETVYKHFNIWKSTISQMLRDTAFGITQEFSASPQATPEQLRERGALFHYAPGEKGLERVQPPAMSLDMQANMLELHRERQKGGFNDAVYGMVEGQAGYALSLLASSSANQILYPYMDAKHFVISESDRFWLSRLKSSKRVFQVKGQFVEKLSPTDIPDDVSIKVESQVATPKDWMERGTIGNMVDKHLDEDTIITEIYGLADSQAVKRRKKLDLILQSPEALLAEKIVGFYSHADYLAKRGDRRGAAIFRRLAQGMEAQIGIPPAGQGRPAEMSRIMAQREAGTPEERTRVSPEVSPPEAQRGFSPEQLRQSIGRGTVRTA